MFKIVEVLFEIVVFLEVNMIVTFTEAVVKLVVIIVFVVVEVVV